MLKWISHLSFSLLTYIRLLKDISRVLHSFIVQINKSNKVRNKKYALKKICTF